MASRIKAIKRVHLDTPVPVYDLTSNKFENFSIESGVIVHNSKDAADAVCGSVYQAINKMSKYNANLAPEDYVDMLNHINKPSNIYEAITKGR